MFSPLFRKRFSSRNIDGLALWLEGEKSPKTFGSGTNLSQWNDLSGNGNHVAQANAAQRPNLTTELVGGYDGVTFTQGNGDLMTAPDSASIRNIWDAGAYAAVVCKVTGSGGTDSGRFLNKNQWNIGYSGTLSGAARVNFVHKFTGNDGLWVTTARPVIFNKVQLIELWYDRGSAANAPTIVVDGVEAAVTTSIAPTLVAENDSADALAVGGPHDGTTTTSIEGSLLEVVLYNTLPAAETRAKIRAYAMEKYGIA